MMTQSDVPADARTPGADPTSVMHASLTIGDALPLGSDDPTGDGGPKVGSAVASTSDDTARSAAIFEELAVGGEITAPFGATSCSRGFGMCTDRFGVPWMVDTAGEPDG